MHRFRFLSDALGKEKESSYFDFGFSYLHGLINANRSWMNINVAFNNKIYEETLGVWNILLPLLYMMIGAALAYYFLNKLTKKQTPRSSVPRKKLDCIFKRKIRMKQRHYHENSVMEIGTASEIFIEESVEWN